MSDNVKSGGGMSGRGKPSPADAYAGTRRGLVPIPEDVPGEPAGETADAFSTVNRAGRNHQVMLILRFLKGDCKALGYSYLVSVDFTPGAALVLEFTGHKVTIKGRNLLPLFEGIASHKVGIVQATDGFADQSEDKATVVHSIDVEESK